MARNQSNVMQWLLAILVTQYRCDLLHIADSQKDTAAG